MTTLTDSELEAKAAKMFPIMIPYWLRTSHPRSIPWDMLQPHEAQAIRNHGSQTLARLAERGGLAPMEAICILTDREFPHDVRFHLPEQRQAYLEYDAEKWRELQGMVLSWLASAPARARVEAACEAMGGGT